MSLSFNTVGNPLHNPKDINRNFLRGQGSFVDFSQFRDLYGNRKAAITGTVPRSIDPEYALNYGPFTTSEYMNFGTPKALPAEFTFFAVMKILDSVNSYPISCRADGSSQGFEIIAGPSSTAGAIAVSVLGSTVNGFCQVNLSNQNNWVVVVATLLAPILYLFVYEPDAAPSSRNLLDIDVAGSSVVTPSAPYAINDRDSNHDFKGHIASHGFITRSINANRAQYFSQNYYDTLLRIRSIPSLLNSEFPIPSIPIIPAGFQNLGSQYSSISALQLGGALQQ